MTEFAPDQPACRKYLPFRLRAQPRAVAVEPHGCAGEPWFPREPPPSRCGIAGNAPGLPAGKSRPSADAVPASVSATIARARRSGGTQCPEARRLAGESSTLRALFQGYDRWCSPEWRNWQTRGTQNPVSFGTCGFDPHLRHRRKARNHAGSAPTDLLGCVGRAVWGQLGGQQEGKGDVTEIGPAGEDEMVLAFVRAEFHSRESANLHALG